MIAAYVLASGKNATNFRRDLLFDIEEFYKAVTKRHEAIHAELISELSVAAEQEGGVLKEVFERVRQGEVERGAQTQGSDAAAALYSKLISEFGLKANTKPKRARDMAREIQEEADFDPMFKICSKIMHRTSLSIASSRVPGSLDEAIPFLRLEGASQLVSIYSAVKKHVDARGLLPPED